MIITEDKLHKCLVYLAETDEQYGRLKATIDGLERNLKITEALGVTENKGKGGVDYVKSLSRTSADYIDVNSKITDAAMDFYIIEAKRETAATIISVWQSMQKAMASGNIR